MEAQLWWRLVVEVPGMVVSLGSRASAWPPATLSHQAPALLSTPHFYHSV